jgi:hypothetical protein
MPPLGMSEDGTIDGFVHTDTRGSNFSYLRNYTDDGTAFFVSGVLENVVRGGECTSSITFVPIPNNEGQYPISFAPDGLFNITCATGSTESTDRERYWVYRVAGMLYQC